MKSTKLFASMFAIIAASFSGFTDPREARDDKHKHHSYSGRNNNAKSSFKQNKRRGL